MNLKSPGEGLPHHPKEYINHLVRSDDFLKNRNTAPTARDALGKTASHFIEVAYEKSEYLNMDELSIKLLGQLQNFGVASRALERSEDLSRDERKQYKKDVIAYNHTIREMIDTNGRITSGAICDFVGATEMLIGGDPKQAKFVREKTREIVFGMQSEIFTEDALWSIPGVDIPELSEEESQRLDAKGVDIYFTFNGKDYYIDVKATREAFHRAMDKRMESGYHYDSDLFWTGLEIDEIGGAMRPTDYQRKKIREKLIREFQLYEPSGTAEIA